MNDLLGLLWLIFIMVSGVWVLSNVLVPLVLHSLKPGKPAVERQRLWMLVLLPWLLPFLVVVVIFGLAGAKQLGWMYDHCLYHVSHHPHFCLEHLPQVLMGYPHLFAVFSVSGLLLCLMFNNLCKQFHQFQNINALSRLVKGKKRLKILDEERVVGFASGLIKPNIFLSKGLLQRLSKRQCRIVLAHEIAHIRHGDLWLNSLFEWFLMLHFNPTGKKLRSRWRASIELHADDKVATRFGHTNVAETLLTLVKPAISSSQIFPNAIAGGDTVVRIHRLLNPPAHENSSLFFESLFYTGLLAFVVLLTMTHHSIETLLGWMLGI